MKDKATLAISLCMITIFASAQEEAKLQTTAMEEMDIFIHETSELPSDVSLGEDESADDLPIPYKSEEGVFPDLSGFLQRPSEHVPGLNGEYSIGDFTGDLQYSYPIYTPQGRSGLAPSLVLRYASSSKNTKSILGTGWTLDVPKIERYSRTGIEDLYSLPNFMSSLAGGNGELTLESVDAGDYGTYLPRTWSGKARYEFKDDNTWAVSDARGTVYSFGVHEESREQSADGSLIHTWYLDEIRDSNGNTVTYEYVKSQGVPYLKRITYGSVYEIQFEPYFSGQVEIFDDFPLYHKGFPLIDRRDLLESIAIHDTASGDKIMYALQYSLQGGIDFQGTSFGGTDYLKQVTVTGVSAAGDTETLQPTSFEYASYTDADERSFPILLPDLSDDSGYNNMYFYWTNVPMWIFGDHNGDGWDDLVTDVTRFKYVDGSYHHLPHERVFLSQGNGQWYEDPNPTLSPLSWAWEYRTAEIRDRHHASYIDHDGDMVSHLCIRATRQDSAGFQCHNEPSISNDPHNTLFMYFDFNGDGLPDILKYYHKHDYYGRMDNWTYRNNGAAGFEYVTQQSPWHVYDNAHHDEGTLLGDINGDGLDDVVHHFILDVDGSIEVDTKKVFINTGSGWQEITGEISLPQPVRRRWCNTSSQSNCYDSGATKTFQLVDINRDGLADLLWSGDVYLNNGKGWNDNYFEINWLDHYPDTPFDNSRRYAELADLNKDGILDRIYTSFGFGPVLAPSTRIHPSEIYDLPVLTRVTQPQGGEIRFEYTPASSYTNPDGSASNIELPVSRLTLSSATTDDGFGNQATTTYHYAGGKLYRAHVQEQEFLGFREVTRTLPDGSSVEREYLQGDAASTFAEKGLLKTEWVLNSAGVLLREAQHVYTVSPRGVGSFQALEESAVTISYSETDPGVQKARAVQFSYDEYGNVTEAIDYGEVQTGASFGEFTDSATDRIVRTIEYAQNVPAHILSLPQREERRDYDDTLIAETRFHYDGLPLGQVDVGNVTKQELLLETPSTYLTMLSEYNGVGLPTRVTNTRGYDTTISYDTYDLFPTSVTNPKGHTTQYEFNSLFATPSSATDANGGRTITALDPLGRSVETRVSNPANPSQDVTTTTSSYDTQNFPNSVTTTVHTGNAGIDIISRTYFDGFGRTIQIRQEAEGADQYTTTSTLYDDRGNVSKELLPVFGDGSAFQPFDPAGIGTIYTYDPLNRIMAVSTPVGATSTVYDAWTQMFTDANGHRKDFQYDARENLVGVVEYLEGSAYTTQYDYDALNNLTQITDAFGNIRRMTYDLQGRKLSEEDLHTPGDSTFGVWSFTYDENANLIGKTDPRVQTVAYTYDELDRVLTENASTGAGVEVSYEYDQGVNGIGRLTGVNTAAVTKQLSYDVLGRVVQEQKTIDGATYTTSFTYDLAGNPLSMSYPDGMVVAYDYDSAGQLGSLQQDGVPVVENLDYAPVGLVSRIDYANGVSTVNTYDPELMYRLTRKETTGPAGARWQDIGYTFDPVGNIVQMSDASATAAAKTAVFAYDDLDRLLAATATGTGNGADYTRAYSYDILGNMLSRSDIGTYSYAGGEDGTSSGTSANPHAVTNVAGAVYSYDANGNLTSNGTWSHSWDYQDRLISSTDGSQTVTYAYDESGARVLKENLVTRKRTVYVNEYYDIEDGASKRHIYAGSLKVASDTVAGAAGTHPSCRPPAEGDWLVTESCTFTGEALAAADVVVDPDVVLTVATDAVLEIDLHNQKLLVRQDGGVLIKEEGAVRQSSGTILPSVGYAGLVYHHDDHLSGSNVDTDVNGELLEVADYYPFGDVRLDEQFGEYENDYKFTGKELDEDTGLHYYEARYYDARIGRFVSIDPWFGDVADPQSFNKYAYARNNPLKYIDLTGRSFQNFLEGFARALDWVSANVVIPAGDLITGGKFSEIENRIQLRNERMRQEGPSLARLGEAVKESIFDAAEIGAIAFGTGYTLGEGTVIARGFVGRVSSRLLAHRQRRQLTRLFSGKEPPKASDIKKWAESQGWVPKQTKTGPLMYVDENGTRRVVIKRGSKRTPGSEPPHVSIKSKDGDYLDPATGRNLGQGNSARTSEGNHRQIDYDL